MLNIKFIFWKLFLMFGITHCLSKFSHRWRKWTSSLMRSWQIVGVSFYYPPLSLHLLWKIQWNKQQSINWKQTLNVYLLHFQMNYLMMVVIQMFCIIDDVSTNTGISVRTDYDRTHMCLHFLGHRIFYLTSP